jgi:hypothetical protein
VISSRSVARDVAQRMKVHYCTIVFTSLCAGETWGGAVVVFSIYVLISRMLLFDYVGRYFELLSVCGW